MARRFIKYNPSFLSQEELIRNFVVRRSDLELITRIIRDNVTDSNQHLLIIGPRGSGKTTLALRVAAEVENDTELQARWYPLTFSEESYEVVSAAEFWLEALFHLAEQTGDEKRKRTHADLKNETDEQRLGERALAQLLDFADSQGKRILLIVENLNMLFSDLISEDEAWKMRHTLLNEPRLMLLATATSRFEGIDNSSQAMYEMFKLHELKRLDTTECNNIWEMITGSKLIGEQIRPIEILTGGNPRLLTIIAGFSAHRSFGKLLEDLVDLIDDHTEYFKSHLDNLPPIERKAYLALAEMWDPSTARDIARSARLDVSKTSSLLNRLVGRGAVIVERQEKKTKWYMVAERMYNIYYLMRRRGKPADRVKAAVKFMISMYDPETASSLITEEACKLSPELCQNHYLAYEITLNQVRDHHLVERIIAATPKSFLDSPYMNEVFKNLSGVRNIETELSLDSEESPALLRARKFVEDGRSLFREGRYDQAIEKLDQAIEELSHSDTLLQLAEAARAMFNKGVSLGALNRSAEEIQVYDELVALYKGRTEPQIVEQVAMAMINKGMSLGALNRSAEEIQVYDELVALYKERPEPQIAEKVAMAMFNKGVSLGALNRSAEEIQVYDELVALYRERPEPQIVEQVATAMVNKGYRLGALNRSAEAIQVYDELVALYKERPEPQIAEKVAMAMVNKGISLYALNRSAEAIPVYDELVALYKGRTEPQIVEKVARALVNKGKILIGLDRPAEAEAVFIEAIEINPAYTKTHIQLINLLLNIPGREDEALMKASEVISANPENASLLNSVAWDFYEHGSLSGLEKAQEWAQSAVLIKPESSAYQHTLACILAACGSKEALVPAKKYIQDDTFVEQSIDDAIQLFVVLAAAGYTKEALDILVNSPAAKHLEPLVAGLRLFIGEKLTTAVEILEVAKDVVKRIEERMRRRF